MTFEIKDNDLDKAPVLDWKLQEYKAECLKRQMQQMKSDDQNDSSNNYGLTT